MTETTASSVARDDEDIERPQVTRDKELFDSVNNLFVEHPRLAEAKRYADQLVALGPYADEAPCSEICGPAGVGKSTLWNWIKAGDQTDGERMRISLPKRTEIFVRRRPLLAIKLQQQPTLEKMCNAFLQELGDPWWWQGQTTEKTERVDLLLHHAQVHVVYIDEFQYVVDRSGVVVSEAIVDWLRDRHMPAARIRSGLPNARSVALCLLGMGRLTAVFSDDAQRLRRWDAGWRIEPYGRGTGDLEDFAGIISAFFEACALPVAPDLDVTDPDLVGRFQYATWGIPGELKKLFGAAMRVAGLFPEKHPALDLRLLERGFELQVRKEEHVSANSQAGVGSAETVPMQNPFSAMFDPTRPSPPLLDDRAALPSLESRRRTANQRRALNWEVKRSFSPR